MVDDLTVKAKGRAEKPTKKQRAAFAAVLSAKEFGAVERCQRLEWANTRATRYTIEEMTDWLRMERFKRERATPGAEPEAA